MRRALLLAAIFATATGTVMCTSFGADTSVEPVDDAGTDHVVTEGGASADALLPDAALPRLDAAPSCPAPAVSEGLVAYYPFNELSGIVVPDCASPAHAGTILNASGGEWGAGRNSGALDLAASNGCVDLGASAPLAFTTAFTVSVWVNVPTLPLAPTAGYIVSKTLDPDLAGWRLAVGAEGITAAVAGFGGMRVAVSGLIPPKQWVHVALVVIPGGELTLHVDGVKHTTPGLPSPLIADTSSAARIGCNSDSTMRLVGMLDDLQIYSRALSDPEILALAK